jgi:hypothetical protein
MEYIKGYKFNTKEEVDFVINQLNEHYGLPIPGGSCYFNETSFEKLNDFYVLQWGEIMNELLGEPIEIEVNEN